VRKNFFILLVVLLFLSLLSFMNFFNKNKKETANFSRVCFNKTCIPVELAVTNSERERGLMYRDFLADDAGMLFIFNGKGTYPFWMKNMKFPIDIIWINDDAIVHIERDVPPCASEQCLSYWPEEEANYVLEVPANFTLKTGLEVGSKVEFYK